MKAQSYTLTSDSLAIRTKNGKREAVTVPSNATVLLAEPSQTVSLIQVIWNSEALHMFADDLDESNELQHDAPRFSEQQFDQFAFTMAHDLQAPLRSIGVMTEVFLRNVPAKLDPESLSMLQYVVSGVDRMKRLIRDILDLATVRNERELVAVDCGVVVETALQNLRDAVEQSGARITIENLPTIYAQEGQLVRLFQNLIGNAIKYHGDRVPTIRIAALEEADQCVFSVQDNGLGIEAKFHDQIFEAFHRVHSGRQHQGTGVGLAIAKRIVEWHQGRIWLESEPGKGSIFYFSIPLAQPDTAAVNGEPKANHTGASTHRQMQAAG